MKHVLVSIFTYFIFSSLVAAQDANEYFVVVETNVHQQDYSIVKICDEYDQLLYEEYIEGIYIDITSKKHREIIIEVNKLFKLFMIDKVDKGQYEGFIESMFNDDAIKNG